jgi:hypothetical protein
LQRFDVEYVSVAAAVHMDIGETIAVYHTVNYEGVPTRADQVFRLI